MAMMRLGGLRRNANVVHDAFPASRRFKFRSDPIPALFRKLPPSQHELSAIDVRRASVQRRDLESTSDMSTINIQGPLARHLYTRRRR